MTANTSHFSSCAASAATSPTTDKQLMDIQHHLDTKGLICPEPVMLLHKVIRQADAGDVIEVLATDPASTRDIANFCRHLGHELLLSETLQPPPSIRTSDVSASAADMDEQASYDEIYRYILKKKPA